MSQIDMPQSPLSSRLRTFLAIAAAAICIGCESAPKATSRLDLALGHYHAQRYSLAHQHALDVARSPASTDAQREQAAYIAGLSAFRNGDSSEAELRLMPLTNSADRNVRATSQAVMGQIRLEQNRPAEAATLLDLAANGLDGHEAAQARRYAATAYERAGNPSAAERSRRLAAEAASPLRSGFTLQVGAFSERVRADRAASEAQQVAGAHGLGSVAVRPTTDSRGRSLYLVQIGQFPTRQAAAHARTSLGRLDFIVAPRPQ